ncbi:MAG: M28 family metallopeptidase [Eubacteriales bacterium]
MTDCEIRKNRRQKNEFISMLQAHFGERMRVEESGKIIKSRNIVIGDPDSAEIIFTAHYDTCARLPFPNFITPLNLPFYIVYQLLITVLMFIPPFLLSVTAAALSSSVLLTEIALILTLAAEVWLILAGPANPHTANDNTSGIVTVLTLADGLFADAGGNSDKYAFVLFDNEEVGLFGSAGFAQKHPGVRKSGFVVNLDCVSDGDSILFLTKEGRSVTGRKSADYIEENAQEILAEYGKTPVITKKALYPSDQMAFKNSIAVAALKKSRFGVLYMNRIHTPRDTVFDERNTDALVKLFSDIILS